MKKTTTNHTQFELNGVIYLQTESGYCFTAEREHEHSGYVKLNKRISKDAYNEAFEQYMEEQRLNIEMELDDASENPEVSLNEFCEMIKDGHTNVDEPAVINEYGCVDCTDCEVECVHRNCMRRNPFNVGGLGECPRLKTHTKLVKEEKVEKTKKTSSKPSKPRRSKDVAYEGHGITLTAKQVSFIRHLPDTSFWQDGLDSCVWVDCLCDDITGEFAEKPMTVGAMISTLCEKGLGERTRQRVDGRKCTSFNLTALGKKIASDLGLA